MDDFERFLIWLDPDPEKAAAKYNEIQRKLTRFFLSRGCGVDAEALADETIERVVRRIREFADTYEGEPIRYLIGVARNVFREWLDEQIKKSAFRPPRADSEEEREEKEELDKCLQKCMKNLSENDRDLIIGYYTGAKQEKIDNRKLLAEEHKMGVNALRIKAYRIRTALRECIEKCLEPDSYGAESEEDIGVQGDDLDKNHETDRRNRH